MPQFKIIPVPVKFNFYLNLLNLVPFLAVIITGLILQLEYHFHRLPGDYLVASLNKSGWLSVHKVSAFVSLTGIIIHCVLHRKFIAATAKKIFNPRSKTRILLSFYLFIIYILTALTATGSWFFLDPKNDVRNSVVEIHDKLALLLIIISVLHIISRSGWMIKTYQKKK